MVILTILVLTSCTNGPGLGVQRKVKALGVANQITIISEDNIWNGPVGDSLEYYLASVFPVLPRPENLFDIRHFTPFEVQVENLRRELRTYLLVVNTSDTSSKAYKLAAYHLGQDAMNIKEAKLRKLEDKWATDQLILYLMAPDVESLSKAVSQYFPTISEQVRQHDLKQIVAKTYLAGENKPVAAKIEEKLGAKFRIPGDYVTAIEEDSLFWLRKDYEDITVNLVFELLPYRNQEQFSKGYMKSLRDDFGREYVSSASDTSYMRINDKDLPMYTFNRDINGHYALEARGIWEMVNDFMGGPFVSYLIHLKDRNALLFVDGFVLAPGHSKKAIMQELEVIVNSLGGKRPGEK